MLDAFSESRARFGIGTGSIADIGCGTGLFLSYLSRFGGALIGVDRSPSMLRLAAKRLRGTPARLLRMDMRRLALPEPVETLSCTFDTINYLLSPSDLAATIRGFARNLLPGGTLVFDFIPEGASRGGTRARQSLRIGAIRSEWRIRIDPEGRGSVAAIRLGAPGHGRHAWTEIHRQRWPSREEVMRALAAAGFDPLDCRPVEPGGAGDWLHVVARRAAAASETSR
ncbi:class I SAM-dependent DNA methyltransferase [Amaricoccus solimangrovi]|uniref:class I SAM-dependent DNA methyltransferase n=1 Tax=Amaricoccus solimangrovi TaxID=2589815 RepID=UPI0015E3BA8F|nr:class I SAM-dependent methyltransferase [Amaricoccus solimangrovi]